MMATSAYVDAIDDVSTISVPKTQPVARMAGGSANMPVPTTVLARTAQEYPNDAERRVDSTTRRGSLSDIGGGVGRRGEAATASASDAARTCCRAREIACHSADVEARTTSPPATTRCSSRWADDARPNAERVPRRLAPRQKGASHYRCGAEANRPDETARRCEHVADEPRANAAKSGSRPGATCAGARKPPQPPATIAPWNSGGAVGENMSALRLPALPARKAARRARALRCESTMAACRSESTMTMAVREGPSAFGRELRSFMRRRRCRRHVA